MTTRETGIARGLLVVVLAFATSGANTELRAQDAGTAPAKASTTINGTALYRERLALPPNAIFEALLEDTSFADARATVVARTTILNPSPPPIRFSIAFDPSEIDSSRTYSVRARIQVDGKLWFTSDTVHPVLTRGAGNTVDILLIRVEAQSP